MSSSSPARPPLRRRIPPRRRCRPETSAGTPAWLDSAEAVSRALRLIGEGALDDGDGMESLAGRVGLSSRQLRRLFTEHLALRPSRSPSRGARIRAAADR
jgi:methylphosphotriester-DNA--protein-cysteine methyltransferase